MGNSEKILLPSLCEGVGAVYESGKPIAELDGKVWWQRPPGVSVVFDGVPISMKPYIPGVI